MHKPFGGRVPPRPAGGAYSAPPDLADLKGWDPRGGGGKGKGKGEKGEGN